MKKDAFLVLEGGGVKGSALVGALSIAVQHLNILGVAGTSAGAIVASLYAAGYKPDELSGMLSKAPFDKFRDVRRVVQLMPWTQWFSPGYCSGEYFYRWIKEQISRKCSKNLVRFIDLELPLKVVAADLTNQALQVFDRNQTIEVATAVRMSMSIPLFFKAYRWGESVMVDGGVVSNFPVWIFKEEMKQLTGKAVHTIGFKLQETVGPSRAITNLVDIATATLATCMKAREELITKLSPVTVCSIPTEDVSATDFDITEDQRWKLFEGGQHAAEDFFSKWEQQQEGIPSLSTSYVSYAPSYVSYADKRDTLLQFLGELKQEFESRPQNKERLLHEIEVAISEVLALAIAITDELDHNLSANFMAFRKEESKLVMTHVMGMYARWRIHREFFPDRPAQAGSCGKAFNQQEILIIPNCEGEPGMMWLPFPDERRSLKGVINIPIRGREGVVNIDTPISGIFSEGLRERAVEIQQYMEEILSIRKSVLQL